MNATRLSLFSIQSLCRSSPKLLCLKSARHTARGGLNMGGSTSRTVTSGAETMKQVQSLIQSNCVVIFSKTTCPYCTMAKQVFEKLGQPYSAIELNRREDGGEIQRALTEITGARTVPRVFVNGQCIGGGSETRDLHEQGRLVKLLADCGPGNT